MDDEDDLFFEGLDAQDLIESGYYARPEDPETSHESAKALKRRRLEAMWIKVLRFLAENDRSQGHTDWEVIQALPDQLGECPWHRCSDCRREGFTTWIYDDEGKPIKRLGGSNQPRGASRITEKGLRWAGLLRLTA